MRTQRRDFGRASKTVRSPEGFLVADAAFTRTGVFLYVDASGKELRELRPPEEVFAADSLSTLGLKPLTLLHPPGAVDAQNAKAEVVGAVDGEVRREGDFLVGRIAIFDGAAVRAAETGAAQELSCGYTCELDLTPGEWRGEHYDGVQRDIRYNHVALVPKGRAGPEARVRLDAGEAAQVLRPETAENEPEGPTVKLTIDGIEYEVKPENAATIAQAIARQDAAHATALGNATRRATDAETKLAALAAEKDKATARADAAEAELTKARDPKVQRAAIEARVALETQARKLLGAETKLDGLDDNAVRAAVVAKAFPTLKLDGKSPDYVTALFDSATASDRNIPLENSRAVAGSPIVNDASDDPVEAARKRMLADSAPTKKKPSQE